MENASNDTFCKFAVLVSDNVTKELQNDISSLSKKYKNCSVDIVDMSNQFTDAYVPGWSSAMYYRLNLPEILKDEKRCVYLDGDTMVRNDITDMFKIKMDDYYIAGVRDFNVYINGSSSHYLNLGIDSLETYVCSGVLIMNLEKMRNDNLQEKLKKVVSENNKKKSFKFPDQDALNSACFNHILCLPLKYGALAHTDFTKSYEESEYAKWASNEQDWEEGRTDPTIVHFTGDKPWYVIYSNLCQEWWNYANKTEFKNIISEKYKPTHKI